MATKVKTIGKITINVVADEVSLRKNNLISESDAEMDNRATAAVRSALDRARICKKPVAKYDVATKRAYIEYADGVKKYVN